MRKGRYFDSLNLPAKQAFYYMKEVFQMFMLMGSNNQRDKSCGKTIMVGIHEIPTERLFRGQKLFSCWQNAEISIF
jgi:hypothetical protein